MLVLPQKSLDYSKGLFEISLGTSRISKQLDEGASFRERFWVTIALISLRCIWVLVDFLAKSRISEMKEENEKIGAINFSKLTSASYKILRSLRDDSALQLKELNALHSDDILPAYQIRTLQLYTAPLKHRISILDGLFSQMNLANSHVQGFRAIPEKEIWENRTTAYDYAT